MQHYISRWLEIQMAHKYFVNEGLGMIVCHSQNELMPEIEGKRKVSCRLFIVPTFLGDLI